MSVEGLWIAFLSGVLNAGTILPLVLAMALLYAHGQYLPLWLADLGVIGAYLLRTLWTHGLPGTIALLISLVIVTGLGWTIHRSLMVRFIDTHEPLSALLAGLGLSFAFQGVSSLMGSGMSQHFPENLLQHAWYSGFFELSLSSTDLLGLGFSILISMVLYLLLRLTHLGIRLRAMFANRDLAHSLGFPVSKLDLAVVAAAALLAVLACVFYGNRFDLQPTMMFYPGLTAIAAVVTAGARHPFRALFAAVGLIVGVNLIGVMPNLAPLQRAIPFLVLALVLLARASHDRGSVEETAA